MSGRGACEAPPVAGLLLAAGAGTRMGRPKALVAEPDGTSWLRTARQRMLDAGCRDVLVVLGAESDRARPLVADAWSIVADDWRDGISASLRAGLLELADGDDAAALVHLVDLPDTGADVLARLLRDATEDSLRRAVFAGRPGHPVVIGRRHWAPLIEELRGDRGASAYLARHGVDSVECGDLATGRDEDTPDGLERRAGGALRTRDARTDNGKGLAQG